MPSRWSTVPNRSRKRSRSTRIPSLPDITERLDARAHLVLAPPGHRLDVGPRREELPAAPHDEGADVGSFFRFANRFAELEPDLQIDRVRGLAVDADHADAVVNLETNELAHGGAAYPVSTAAAS